MKAVILAGGKGKRLGEITKKIPKPMVKICGTPLLEHQINILKNYGIKDIVILTSHLSEIIKNYFKNGSKFGVKISYNKNNHPLGTAGALKEMEPQLTKDFILTYGDIMFDINLKKIINFHKKKRSICTLILHPNDHPHDSDLIEADHNKRIFAIHPKPHNINKYYKNLVNSGLYMMSPRIFRYIKKNKKADFGKDVFPKIISKEKLYGYNSAEYVKDIGTPKRLKEVVKDYKSGKISKSNNNNKRKAIFLDRDGVINKEINLLHKIKDFKLLPQTAKAIKKINKSGYLAIVITNQPVIARNLCSIEELEEIHKKMETLLGEAGAKLDGIYYCPHHPDKGYLGENQKYKINCSCRKPKIGMLKKATKDFNINLSESFIIGDTYRDILCGKNAGVTTIKLKSKLKSENKPENINAKADMLFDNLFKAVNFIVKERKF